MIIAGCIITVLVLFIGMLLIKGALFWPKPDEMIECKEPEVDENIIAEHLSQMIRCRTVSAEDDYPDGKAFNEFRELIKKQYPVLHKNSGQERVGSSGILYHINGKNADKPSVLMGHYDVVPVNETEWSKPAFEGIIEEDIIWGRGTLDTKCTVCATLEAIEAKLKEGFEPKQDIWLAFSGDEEIFGPSCPAMVSELTKRGVKPAFVLDEGGAIVRGAFPGVAEPAAMIGIAEKGGMNVALNVSGSGGHAATPPAVTDTSRLAEAICNISKHPFEGRITEPVRLMFDVLGRKSSFLYRVLFANMWLFSPIFKKICLKSGGELNAMVRTTTAVTMLKGSDAYNVLPSGVSAGINLRLLFGDTVDSALNHLKKVINDDKVSVKLIMGDNPSVVSEVECDEYEILKTSIRETWRDMTVTPYLMMACSDSRHFGRICKNVYRFSGMELSSEERKKIHGTDECIPVAKMKKTVQFYINLISRL